MPFKDRDQHRKFQREWKQARRDRWMSDKCCVVCGTKEDLHLHHIDPSTKTSHRIWSWRWDRLEAEAAKCEVRCSTHHKEIHALLKTSL